MTSTRVAFIAVVLTALAPFTAAIGEASAESAALRAMADLGPASAVVTTTGSVCGMDEDVQTEAGEVAQMLAHAASGAERWFKARPTEFVEFTAMMKALPEGVTIDAVAYHRDTWRLRIRYPDSSLVAGFRVNLEAAERFMTEDQEAVSQKEHEGKTETEMELTLRSAKGGRLYRKYENVRLLVEIDMTMSRFETLREGYRRCNRVAEMDSIDDAIATLKRNQRALQSYSREATASRLIAISQAGSTCGLSMELFQPLKEERLWHLTYLPVFVKTSSSLGGMRCLLCSLGEMDPLMTSGHFGVGQCVQDSEGSLNAEIGFWLANEGSASPSPPDAHSKIAQLLGKDGDEPLSPAIPEMCQHRKGARLRGIRVVEELEGFRIEDLRFVDTLVQASTRVIRCGGSL